jgi:hypothetical protein
MEISMYDDGFVRPLNPKNGRQTETHRKTLGNTSAELKFHQIDINGKELNVTDGTIQEQNMPYY